MSNKTKSPSKRRRSYESSDPEPKSLPHHNYLHFRWLHKSSLFDTEQTLHTVHSIENQIKRILWSGEWKMAGRLSRVASRIMGGNGVVSRSAASSSLRLRSGMGLPVGKHIVPDKPVNLFSLSYFFFQITYVYRYQFTYN